MRAQMAALMRDEPLLASRHLDVAETSEPARPERCGLDDADLRMRHAVVSFEHLVKVQKPTAFCHRGKPCAHRLRNRRAHRDVLRKLARMQLGIAPAEIQPIGTGRQRDVGKRRELHKFGDEQFQQPQRVGIVEAERIVARHRDAATRMCGRNVGSGSNGLITYVPPITTTEI